MGQRLLGRTNEGTLEPEPVAAGDRPALGSGGRALPWALRARPGPPGRTGRPTRPVRGEVTLRPSVIGPLTDSDSDGPCRERPGSWRGPVLAATSRRTGGEEKKPDARSPSGGRGRRAEEAGGPHPRGTGLPWALPPGGARPGARVSGSSRPEASGDAKAARPRLAGPLTAQQVLLAVPAVLLHGHLLLLLLLFRILQLHVRVQVWVAP